MLIVTGEHRRIRRGTGSVLTLPAGPVRGFILRPSRGARHGGSRAGRGCPCGRDAVRAFAEKFRAAFPDLNFWGTADLIAEGDYVVGQWEGGGMQTGDAFDDMPTVRCRLVPAR
jgi:SnoaL-like polyketide cyclase